MADVYAQLAAADLLFKPRRQRGYGYLAGDWGPIPAEAMNATYGTERHLAAMDEAKFRNAEQLAALARKRDRLIRSAAKFGKSEISRIWIDELCNMKEEPMEPKTEERSTDHATAILQERLSHTESLLKCRENDVKSSEGTLARHRDLRDKCEAEVKSLKKALKKLGV